MLNAYLQKKIQGAGNKVPRGYVVHPGDTKLPLGPDAWAWPFAEF